jgi:hypothetical protein
MRREDEAKTGFTIPFGIFCFVRMPEGLRNAGSTFNRMMKLILGNQLGRNASAYVDDIVIMSEREKDHIADLTETFDNMRRNGLKLNPEKCIFGIRKGKLLGCMVSKRGIQVNPQKIEALRRMQPPSSRKEVQRLTGRIASLNRFISKAAERSLPFFKVLRTNSTFQWGPVLTPKFGKESDLWVRFEKESVWWKEGYFQRFSAKRSAVGYLLRFGKGIVELILRDWTVTWLNQGRRMDG